MPGLFKTRYLQSLEFLNEEIIIIRRRRRRRRINRMDSKFEKESRPEETSCHTDFNDRHPANTGEKNSRSRHHHRVTLSSKSSRTLFLSLSLSLSRFSLSLYPSLSSIAPGSSPKLQPVSTYSWYQSVLAGQPMRARLCVKVYKKTSLMSLSLLIQQCPSCFFPQTWIVYEMGGKWLYSYCLLGCCFQDLFKTTHIILV